MAPQPSQEAAEPLEPLQEAGPSEPLQEAEPLQGVVVPLRAPPYLPQLAEATLRVEAAQGAAIARVLYAMVSWVRRSASHPLQEAAPRPPKQTRLNPGYS